MQRDDIYPEDVRGLENAVLGEIWPDRETFRRLAAVQRIVPVVTRVLADQDTPISLYRRLAGENAQNTFLLESHGQGDDSRWSIIGVHARATLTEKNGAAHWSGDIPDGVPTDGDPLDALRATAEAFRAARLPELPPFTGGLVGFIAYDAVRRFETVGPKPKDTIGTPELCMLLAQDVAVYDHTDSTVLLAANALNLNGLDTGVDAAYDDAVERISRMSAALTVPVDTSPIVYSAGEPQKRSESLDQAAFEAAVEQSIQEIVDGEIFQVVPSRRVTQATQTDPLSVYRVLRRLNPSPYMFLLRAHDADGVPLDVVGASPETLVTVRSGTATTHPIAGSRPRGATPDEDRRLREELLADPKDTSEHIMLVDLARNDLQKVCSPGTVQVEDFKHVVQYSHVMHLVSTVHGRLREDAAAFDALRACFPAGTLTGAPKPRALEIINRLEPVARGVYGGTVGYIDFAGDLDMAIAIRTTVMKNGQAHVQAGAGIVADSNPTMEFRETDQKAAAALRAVQAASSIRSISQQP